MANLIIKQVVGIEASLLTLEVLWIPPESSLQPSLSGLRCSRQEGITI